MRTCCVFVLMAAAAPGQTPSTEPALAFEAVSIKARKPTAVDPSRPETLMAGMPQMRGGPGTGSPDRVHYSNVTLMSLLMKAWDLHVDQVVGPGWLKQDKFNLEAVLPPGVDGPQFRRMLQRLIADRFQLAVEWQEREFKIYRLSAAKGGPKLKPSAVAGDEEAEPLAARATASSAALDKGGCPVLPPDRRAAVGRNGCTTYIGWTMGELATSLGMMVANETGKSSWANVRDETGISGRFDFTLRYDMISRVRANTPGMEAASDNLQTGDPTSIFKAVEAQLGLRLEPVTTKLKTMVIQRVERVPREN